LAQDSGALPSVDVESCELLSERPTMEGKTENFVPEEKKRLLSERPTMEEEQKETDKPLPKEKGGEFEEPSKHGKIKKIAIAGAAVTAAVVAIIVVCRVWNPKEHSPGTRLLKCDELSVIKWPVLISSNLGNHGPDVSKREGMIYKASLALEDARGNSLDSKSVGVEIHAVGDYDRQDEMELFNGVRGKFYTFLIRSGSSLKFTISAYDQTGHPLTLPHFTVSFF